MISRVHFGQAAEAFIQQTLPSLNSDVETGRLTPDDLLAKIRPYIDALKNGSQQNKASLARDEARYILQLFGFLISSLERHFRVIGSRPGEIIAQTDCDLVLTTLANIAEHPPRDTHYTYWLWNTRTPPLTFTEDIQEHYFNLAVMKTHELHSESNDGLRRICTGEWMLESNEATNAIEKATSNTSDLRGCYLEFFKKMTPQFFMTRMRTYLLPYPVGGDVWSGVNAANLAAQMQMDYLVGTFAADFYLPIVKSRKRYLTKEDRDSLSSDIKAPSLASHFFQRMKADPTASLRNTTPLAAFNDLVKIVGLCSATHWSLIFNYLIKPAATMSQTALAKLPVSPKAGTGEMAHDTTERIMRMRRYAHPIRTVIDKRLSDEKERKAVLLYHLEGLTFEEIETQLGWLPGDAEVALRSGVSSLELADLGLQDGDIPRCGA